jgi:hypothetical protein
MKYKVLVINDKILVEELERQAKAGFEFCCLLEKNSPNASSDVTAYKILFKGIKR